MTSPVNQTDDRLMFCHNPECVDAAGRRSLAEPEQDGEVHFHCCGTCGATFNFRRPPTASVEETCAIGVPEPVRRHASAAMQHALAQSGPTGPLMQIGRRPDASA